MADKETSSGTATGPAAGSAPATGASDDSNAAGATPTAAPATGDAGIPALPTPEEWAQAQQSIANLDKALRAMRAERDEQVRAARDEAKSKMTEAEAKEQELAELRGLAEEWQVERASLFLENEVSRLAVKHGIIDPDVVVRLIDWEELEFEDGRPVNTEAVVTAIIREKPYLRGQSQTQQARATGINAGAGHGDKPAVNLNADEIKAAEQAGMTPDRYQALKGVQTLDQWLATRRSGQGNG